MEIPVPFLSEGAGNGWLSGVRGSGTEEDWIDRGFLGGSLRKVSQSIGTEHVRCGALSGEAEMKRMSVSRWLRLGIGGLGLSLAVGCGGGSSGGGTGGGGGNPTTVTFTVKGAAPTAVAARVGFGAFTPETLTSGTLTLSIPSGTTSFAVAYACPPLASPLTGLVSGTITRQTVLEASTADGTSFFLGCAEVPASGQTGTLTGSVDATAIPALSYVSVQAANGDLMLGTAVLGQKGDFSFSAPAGSDRVEVLAYSTSSPGTLPPTSSVVAAKSFDSQQVPGALNGGSPVVLTAADETTPQAVTYKNVPAGFTAPALDVLFNLGGKTGFTVASGQGNSYPALPAGAVESGDGYFLIASAYQTSVGVIGVGGAVAAAATTATAGPMTFTFPAPWSYSGPAAAALPTFDFTYAGFTGKTGVQQLATLTWLTGTSSSADENILLVEATANYLNGSTQVTVPDLSSLTGFLPAPASGTKVEWNAEIAQYSYPAGQTAPSTSTGSLVANVGSYTVP